MNERIYELAFEQLKEIVAESELRLFSVPEQIISDKEKEIEKLNGICDERLALINYLHEEASKRLEIIEQLKDKFAETEEKGS